jgi:hypothetical protein
MAKLNILCIPTPPRPSYITAGMYLYRVGEPENLKTVPVSDTLSDYGSGSGSGSSSGSGSYTCMYIYIYVYVYVYSMSS